MKRPQIFESFIDISMNNIFNIKLAQEVIVI